MSRITINDLEQNEELDQQAMSQVFGGKAYQRLTPALGSKLQHRHSPLASTVTGLYKSSWQRGV